MTDDLMIRLRCLMCQRAVLATPDALLAHGDDCVFCGATAGLRNIDTNDSEREAA